MADNHLIDHAELITWLTERRDNCERIAATKHADHADWLEDMRFFDAAIVRLKVPRTPKQHDGEDCQDDEAGASVCDGIYADRTDEVLGLVEAMGAIRALTGGRSEQARAITTIIDDAIEEHAAWTR